MTQGQGIFNMNPGKIKYQLRSALGIYEGQFLVACVTNSTELISVSKQQLRAMQYNLGLHKIPQKPVQELSVFTEFLSKKQTKASENTAKVQTPQQNVDKGRDPKQMFNRTNGLGGLTQMYSSTTAKSSIFTSTYSSSQTLFGAKNNNLFAGTNSPLTGNQPAKTTETSNNKTATTPQLGLFGTATPPSGSSGATTTPQFGIFGTATPPSGSSGTTTTPQFGIFGTATPPSGSSGATTTPQFGIFGTATPPSGSTGATTTSQLGLFGTASPLSGSSGATTSPRLGLFGTASPLSGSSGATTTPQLGGIGTAHPPSGSTRSEGSTGATTNPLGSTGLTTTSLFGLSAPPFGKTNHFGGLGASATFFGGAATPLFGSTTLPFGSKGATNPPPSTLTTGTPQLGNQSTSCFKFSPFQKPQNIFGLSAGVTAPTTPAMNQTSQSKDGSKVALLQSKHFKSNIEKNDFSKERLQTYPNLVLQNQFGSVKFNKPVNLLLKSLDDVVKIQQDQIEVDKDFSQDYTATYKNIFNLKNQYQAMSVFQLQQTLKKIRACLQSQKLVFIQLTTDSWQLTVKKQKP